MQILIIDDHPLFGDGLAALIERKLSTVTIARADSIKAALEICASRRGQARAFDLVFLDLTLKDSLGLDSLVRFRDRAPGLPVVVISADESPRRVRDSIDAGAMGYIPKTAPRETLLTAVHRIISGHVYVPEFLADRNEFASPPVAGPARLSEFALTQRQIDVFRAVVQGKPNKVISKELGISESTIKKHVSPVLRALGVTDRLQAIVTLSQRAILID